MFVEHPQAHRLGRRGADHGGELGGQFGFELRGLGRVFFRMALARHLQFAAQTAEHLAHAARAPTAPRALLDPRLGVPRLPELPGCQPPNKLRLHRPAHRRPVPRCLAPLEQPGHPCGHDLVAVDKHRLAADIRYSHDLRHGQLVLCDQPHHQQPSPRPLLLRLRPRRFDFRHHFVAQFR